MDRLAGALADPEVRDWYLLFCVAVLVLPMLAIAVWYRRDIGTTAGGRELMQRQAGARPGGPGQAGGNLAEAARMARDIAAGRYGGSARRTQNRVYWLSGLWALANALAFGLYIWADAVNRAVE